MIFTVPSDKSIALHTPTFTPRVSNYPEVTVSLITAISDERLDIKEEKTR